MLGFAVFTALVGVILLAGGASLMVRPATPLPLVTSRSARYGSGAALTVVGGVLLWLTYFWMDTPLI